KDSECVSKGFNLLTNQEYKFARELIENDEKFFSKSFLSNLPSQTQQNMLQFSQPSLNNMVFFKVINSIENFGYKDKDE
ncbi:MAG: hypothetical protein MHPSP_004858, partial [Paramarteilia canceri]